MVQMIIFCCGEQEYLLADGNMSVLPVAFSLMASFMSAITLLGVTQVYLSIFVSVCLSACLSGCLSLFSVYGQLYVCYHTPGSYSGISLYLCFCLSVCLPVFLSLQFMVSFMSAFTLLGVTQVYLSVSVLVSVSVSVLVSVSVPVSLSLSVSLSSICPCCP